MKTIVDRSISVQNTTIFYPIDRAVRALQIELEKLNYSPAIIAEILPFAHDEGCLSGAIELGMLDHEDIERLTEAFVDGFDPVHESHPSWNDAGTWWPSVPTSDEAAEYAALLGEWDSEDAPLNPPPDLDAEDWREFAGWSADIESRNPWDYEHQELDEVGISRR
jgi:hypothetical protein